MYTEITVFMKHPVKHHIWEKKLIINILVLFQSLLPYSIIAYVSNVDVKTPVICLMIAEVTISHVQCFLYSSRASKHSLLTPLPFFIAGNKTLICLNEKCQDKINRKNLKIAEPHKQMKADRFHYWSGVLNYCWDSCLKFF